MRPSELVPVSRAAEILKIDAEHPSLWLLRRLRRLREEEGVDLLVPTRSGMKSPRYRVSLRKIEKHLPELFETETEQDERGAFMAITTKVLKKLEAIDDRLDRTDEHLTSIIRRPQSRQGA